MRRALLTAQRIEASLAFLRSAADTTAAPRLVHGIPALQDVAQPEFSSLAARLGTIFNRKPAPRKRGKRAIYFHDISLGRLAANHGEAEPSAASSLVGLDCRLPALEPVIRIRHALTL